MDRTTGLDRDDIDYRFEGPADFPFSDSLYSRTDKSNLSHEEKPERLEKYGEIAIYGYDRSFPSSPRPPREMSINPMYERDWLDELDSDDDGALVMPRNGSGDGHPIGRMWVS